MYSADGSQISSDATHNEYAKKAKPFIITVQ